MSLLNFKYVKIYLLLIRYRCDNILEIMLQKTTNMLYTTNNCEMRYCIPSIFSDNKLENVQLLAQSLIGVHVELNKINMLYNNHTTFGKIVIDNFIYTVVFDTFEEYNFNRYWYNVETLFKDNLMCNVYFNHVDVLCVYLEFLKKLNSH